MKEGPNPWRSRDDAPDSKEEKLFHSRDTFRSSVRTLKRIGREQQAAQPRRNAKTEEAE